MVQAARDYFEGWYDGDVSRVERALHPDLVKRCASGDLRLTTKDRMIELAGRGEGREDGADRRLDISVADLYGDIASVVVRSAVYREYLHLVRTGDGWRIADALYVVI